MKIAIHHHAPFFRNSVGDSYVISFIGLWLDSLAKNFDDVTYCAFETLIQEPYQDYKVSARNVRMVSLGEYGGLSTLHKRIRSLKRAMKDIMSKFDVIIVRGPTPRQGTFFKIFDHNKIVFFLVGESPKEKLIKSVNSPKKLLSWALNERRRAQTIKIAKQTMVIANNIRLAKSLEEKLGKTVYFVPTSSFKKEQIYRIEDRCLSEVITLLFVGRVCKSKGIQELLEALALLSRHKEFSKKFVLNVVGDGGEGETIDEYRQIARQLGINENVNWYGRVPYGEELFKYYKQSDIFILPSKYEGFPHVIVEAMGFGVPVVVTPVGGIADECRNFKEVYFIDGSAEGIFNAVSTISRNEQVRNQLIKGGYNYVENRVLGKCEQQLAKIIKNNMGNSSFSGNEKG